MADDRSAKAHADVSPRVPGTMKWYGWGRDGEGFNPSDRPFVWPYAERHLGMLVGATVSPMPVAALEIPESRVPSQLMAALAAVVPADRRSTTKLDRLLHAYGKSTRDVLRVRYGLIDYAPDCVVFPQSELEIAGVIAAADRTGAIVIPFGAGSNVAGCLEVKDAGSRPVIAVNLRLMNRIVAIDRAAGTVRAEPGILGPDLEAALNREGLTVGHFPDSFPYSTLGGWVATRSSGMLSDKYGNIEDMVLAIRMVTPAGIVATRAVPHASNGPDPNRLCIGSEGTLGIITEITLGLRQLPAERIYCGYLFRDFKQGLASIQACVRAGAGPVLGRLNDPMKTSLSAAFRRRGGWLKERMTGGFKWFLRHGRAFDLERACLHIAAYEGDAATIRWQRRRAETYFRDHGAVALGRGPGDAFAEGKYDFPYIRDFLLDHNVACDVAETSTTWSNLEPLYDRGMAAIGAALREGGRSSWLGCHLSHSYVAGASLYFSFAWRAATAADGSVDGAAEVAHHAAVKKAALDCFAANGATLSHHHAVGCDHLPWLGQESDVAGGTIVDAVKHRFDPNGIMNPGKLLSPSQSATGGAPLLRSLRDGVRSV